MRQIFLNLRLNKQITTRYVVLRYFLMTGLWFFCAQYVTYAQTDFERTAPSKYRIVFTDKLNSPYTLESPELFLSPRSIERRRKQEIPITYTDLPVTPSYIDSVKASGAKVLTVSKWFNSVTVEVSDDSILNKIATCAFVKPEPVQSMINRSEIIANSGTQGTQEMQMTQEFDYGDSWFQTAIHNGNMMHRQGFTGKNMVIAVLDAGFARADALPVFDNLFEKGQILGTRDFVEPGNDVYLEASHGMSVLSIMGGYLPGELIGTAPDASYWLLRSEDSNTEYIIEEDNWIAAAEFADSAGADIINTSLGYSVFNDSLQSHSYSDMDGNTTRVSRAADMASSKGIVVVVSAGNQGNVEWRYITAPADADSIITVGAIDRSLFVASFSGRGPSSDQQVKPTVMALGLGTSVAGLDSTVRKGNGTSFSAPVIAGLVACLWQANPDAKVMDLIDIICESADRFSQPDDEYGYGIPDFKVADILLKVEQEDLTSGAQVKVFPNPFYNELYIFFDSPVSDPVDITLFDLTGKEIFQKVYPGSPEEKFMVIDSDFESVQKGIYIIRIKAGNISGNSKLIKF